MSFLTSRGQVAPQGIGKPVGRREDARLLTGGGRFADETKLPGQGYACMVRSPHAHALIASIDTGPAEGMPGVIAVLTGSDANLAAKFPGMPGAPSGRADEFRKTTGWSADANISDGSVRRLAPDWSIVSGREGQSMQTKFQPLRFIAAVGIAALIGIGPVRLAAQQAAVPAIHIGARDLGGVVTGKNGPEASVWVIAETSGLPTAFAKIVVTDDQGRYLFSDLPQAKVDVRVRS